MKQARVLDEQLLRCWYSTFVAIVKLDVKLPVVLTVKIHEKVSTEQVPVKIEMTRLRHGLFWRNSARCNPMQGHIRLLSLFSPSVCRWLSRA
jgi:hypothetical protein